jgi:hypothetical protein
MLMAGSGAAHPATPVHPAVLPLKARSREADDLRKFAETTHPDGAVAALDPQWQQRAAAFVAGADRMSEAQYPVEAMRLLSWFKDGHTSVYVPELKSAEWGLRLPLGRDIFADGLYVTSAKDEATPLLGARITRIAGISTEELIRRFAEVFPAAGSVLVHRWSVMLVSSPAFLHAFGLIKGPPDAPVSMEGEMPDGSVVSALLKPRADAFKDKVPLSRESSSLERYAATQAYGARPDPTEDGRNFVWHLDRGNVVYVSLDRPGPDDFSKPFDVFDKEVSAALDSSSGKRLIIDLRRNGGGDNTLCEPMRKRIQRSHFNRPGGLYVLIAPHTFSAAQNLANRLERETFAVFVGEPTGSSPNHCGDAKPFPHADKGLVAQVSTVRWMDSSPFDKRITIMPDLLAPLSFSDHVAGKDAALEAALAHADHRPYDEAILTAPWERESQAKVWKSFWM